MGLRLEEPGQEVVCFGLALGNLVFSCPNALANMVQEGHVSGRAEIRSDSVLVDEGVEPWDLGELFRCTCMLILSCKVEKMKTRKENKGYSDLIASRIEELLQVQLS